MYIAHFLLESLGLGLLDDHLGTVLASLIIFNFVSWTTYHMITKSLAKDQWSASPSKLQTARLKWSHTIVSLVHSIVAGITSLWFIIHDIDSLSDDPIFKYSSTVGTLLAISIG